MVGHMPWFAVAVMVLGWCLVPLPLAVACGRALHAGEADVDGGSGPDLDLAGPVAEA